MQIPLTTLQRPDGLGVLIHIMETRFGAEEDELAEDTLETFENFSRVRGQAITDFIVDWEWQLNEVTTKGWQGSPLILSRELLRRARITAEERRWILMPLQNNLNRYNEIRMQKGPTVLRIVGTVTRRRCQLR